MSEEKREQNGNISTGEDRMMQTQEVSNRREVAWAVQ